MVVGIESECRSDSRRNGGRFPVGIVVGFVRNTQLFELADEQGVVDVVSKADEQMPPFADDAGSLSGDVNDHDHAPWNEKDESHFA